MEWKILLIIGAVILAIILISIIYITAIARKDGKAADPVYAEIAYAAKPAGNILKNLMTENRSAVCRVTRGFYGIHIEVASSGDPPIHYEKEIPGKEHTAEELASLLEYTASDIAHFAGPGFCVIKEYGDIFRVEQIRV